MTPPETKTISFNGETVQVNESIAALLETSYYKQANKQTLLKYLRNISDNDNDSDDQLSHFQRERSRFWQTEGISKADKDLLWSIFRNAKIMEDATYPLQSALLDLPEDEEPSAELHDLVVVYLEHYDSWQEQIAWLEWYCLGPPKGDLANLLERARDIPELPAFLNLKIFESWLAFIILDYQRSE
ncbi:hypothetical protein NUW58_g5573 [Xylaria curta]|uniref:Uncharacterized protein n=1 Tax=Xylaria curta TaxID=42375 RepID=A0ACC1P0Z5_9PEZI|nr:hypothetical protein NUW58_g5573 [Xylaria curta]